MTYVLRHISILAPWHVRGVGGDESARSRSLVSMGGARRHRGQEVKTREGLRWASGTDLKL